jgi:HD-GYP domain-containing protein (c-di-GMP phosphodiesterase class II)/pSer/pThr/pTyr-binding forkhead associated (FHA) protein
MQGALGLVVSGTEQRYPVDEGECLTVGRSSDCEIVLDDQAVSRRHFTVAGRGGTLIVTDLDSANGTFVNERLVQTCAVAAGDTIRAGSVAFDVIGQPDTDTRAVGLPAGGRDLSSMLGSSADVTLAPVISKRFEAARFDWLNTASSSSDTGVLDFSLLQRAQRHLSILHRISEVLASARDLTSLADATLGTILDVTDGDRAAFVLRRQDPDTGGAEVAAARERVAGPVPFVVSRTLVSEVIDKGVSTFAFDAINDDRFSGGNSVAGQQVRSVMCVPLRTSDAILGALYVDSLSEAGRFSEADLELMAALGNQAGVALHRVRLMGELERLLIDTIRAIAATIDAKDGYTHRHSERVAALARRIALEIGLTADQQQTAELSALLHDVGKIAVPDSILNKPGRLTPEEFAEMKKHPLHGARIIANIQSPAVTAVLPGVQYHHERWDGSGYPEGLRGEEIPLLGRLLGVADFYDALTSARPYRPALSPEEAVALLQEGSGTHFDARIVEAVLRLHERHDLLPDGWQELLPLRGTAVLSPAESNPKLQAPNPNHSQFPTAK